LGVDYEGIDKLLPFSEGGGQISPPQKRKAKINGLRASQHLLLNKASINYSK